MIAQNGSAPGTVPDKLQPYNVEAERALLGSVLIDDYRLAEIAHLQLTSDDFYIERHKWAFDAMLNLRQEGLGIGLITVQDRLEREGYLGEFGGPAELSQLLTDTPTSTHALYYAKIVKECAIRRRGIAKLGEASRIFYDESNLNYAHQIALRANELLALANEGSDQDWEIFTLANAYQERPPLAWAVQNLLSLPSLNIIYGAPGTMKSLLTADLLTCVAAGILWLDPLPGLKLQPFQTVQAPTLWVDFDNGKRRTHERFEALGRARNLPGDIPLYYASMPSPWLDVSDALAVDQLANRIDRYRVKLAVLDNLGTVSGPVDENSPAMLPVMSNLRRLVEKTGVAVVVIHHQRKGNGVKGRAGDALRGHSCIEAAIDLGLLVERKEDSDQVSVKSTKTRDVDVLPFAAEWTYEHKPGTSELAEAKFFGAAPERDEHLTEIHSAIVGSVKSNPGITQKRLIEVAQQGLPEASKRAVRGQILSMAKSAELRATSGGVGKATYYYFNEDYVEF